MPLFVEEELKLMLAATRAYLVYRQFKPLVPLPAGRSSAHYFFPLPVREISSQFELILSKDRDIYILMIPSLPTEE